MSHTCEFATGVEANEYGFPVMIHCAAEAFYFYQDKWLCGDHYSQSVKPKGGYIYRQGTASVTVGFGVISNKKQKMQKLKKLKSRFQ